ncbi:MAG TPA: SDR family NAD(P)-dependent oxidoreductase, partial [Pyrinomonadaceae bacterium]
MNSSTTTSRRVALVTGASRGIGRAIAIELGRVGHDVLINYRTNEAEAQRTLELVKAAAGEQGRVELCAADVAGDDDRQRLVAYTREHFGRLDLLVNNAGIAPERRVDLLETSAESFDRL